MRVSASAALAGAVVLLFIAGCGCPYIVNQSVKYRTGNSFVAQLGSIGLLRREGCNVFERRTIPEWTDLEVEHLATVEQRITKKHLSNAASGTEKAVQVSGYEQWQKGEAATLDILAIKDIEAARDELNRNPRILDLLRSNKHFRLVTAVALVSKHERLAEREGGGALTYFLSAPKKIWRIEARADGKTVKSFRISDGAVLGYEFARFCWKPDGTIGEILVDRVTNFGDVECVGGTRAKVRPPLE